MNHGVSRDRTGDLLSAIQALSQLSYNPSFIKTATIEVFLSLSFAAFRTALCPHLQPHRGALTQLRPHGELNPARPCLTSRRPRQWTLEALVWRVLLSADAEPSVPRWTSPRSRRELPGMTRRNTESYSALADGTPWSRTRFRGFSDRCNDRTCSRPVTGQAGVEPARRAIWSRAGYLSL